jgi:hypothetical protein
MFFVIRKAADLKTQSGREARFGRHRFLTERTSVCDALCHLRHEADFH